MAYDEPTCVLKMLNDFRAGNRLSSTFDDPKLSKNKLRKFTDTSVESSSEISSKKLKREINDKISSINRHETGNIWTRISSVYIFLNVYYAFFILVMFV